MVDALHKSAHGKIAEPTDASRKQDQNRLATRILTLATSIIAILVWGCSSTPATDQQLSAGIGSPRPVISLFGRPLPALEMSDSARQAAADNLAQARREFEAAPNDERAIIWLGRRLAYLGAYHEAIEVFSDGLRKHLDSYYLLRHRGHRFITTRQFDRAIDDFTRAAELTAEKPDEVEPDGAPNQYNIPTSTIQTNIWYHLGLAHYLNGDFESAVTAYQRCLQWCRNDDIRVATLYWLYLSAMRAEDEAVAEQALWLAGKDMNLLENEDYYSLLKLFKGQMTVEQLLADAGSDESARKIRVKPGHSTNNSIATTHPPPAPPSEGGEVLPNLSDTTLAYGIAMHHFFNDELDTAHDMFENILATGFWPAFGYIAAEAELARMNRN